MTRIICDTMIWYELSKNKLQIPDPKHYTLVCTYLSLMEIAFTSNSFNNLSEVQNVIKTILNSNSEILLQSPYDYARTVIDVELNPEIEIEEDLVLGFLRVLLNHPKSGLLNNKFKEQLTHISSIRKVNSTDRASYLNNLYKDIKEIRHIIKKYHTIEMDKKHIRGWFLLNLNQYYGQEYSEEQINWEHFEFYEKIGGQYIRNMYLTKMKADRNDENDLKNMIYVQPTDKYWTLEKRWLSLAKEIKLERFLYDQTSSE